MNCRTKGQRTVLKVKAWMLAHYPNLAWISIYQPRGQDQPMDAIVHRAGYWPIYLEIRSNQWGVNKPQTRELAALPGHGFHRQVIMWKDREKSPHIRQWDGTAWVGRASPWEED